MTNDKELEAAEMLSILASYGVVKAVVDFSGSGDSGQIDDWEVEGLADADKVPVRDEHKDLVDDRGCATVDSLVEAFAYSLLNLTGEDWYNNDGGQGHVTFIPGEGKAIVDIGINYMSTDDKVYDYSVTGAGNKEAAETVDG